MKTELQPPPPPSTFLPFAKNQGAQLTPTHFKKFCITPADLRSAQQPIIMI